MMEAAEKWLFKAIVIDTGHVLHHSLPRVKTTHYNLRLHVFELPWKDTRNFLARQLCSDIYCAETAHS